MKTITEGRYGGDAKKPQPMTEAQALSRLAALCARSEHATGELREKMRRWGVAEEDSQRVVDYLTTHHYVDDERFARIYIRDKMTLNKWGRRKIEQGLWAKQVGRATYQPLLDEVTTDEWLAVLTPLLKAKRKTIKAATEADAHAKLVQFALSRGFTYDVVRACLAEEEP